MRTNSGEYAVSEYGLCSFNFEGSTKWDVVSEFFSHKSITLSISLFVIHIILASWFVWRFYESIPDGLSTDSRCLAWLFVEDNTLYFESSLQQPFLFLLFLYST